jgi:pimeloyl-ACP methyl ester carboxylesterase
MAEIQTTQLLVDGLRCLVRASGPDADREAVVFLHGNPGSSEDWLDLLQSAGEFVRAIAPDMPGYGKSERPRQFDYTVKGYAHFLKSLLEALGLDRVHLVLHDFGGPWGLEWAAEHPAHIASLTLINCGVLPGYRWHKFARIWQTPVIGEIFQLIATRRAFRALLNADNPKPFPDIFVNRMFDDSDWQMKRGVLALYRASRDLSSTSARLGETLKQLSLPALVVWGAGDKYIPVRFAEIQKQFFKADVHVLEGSGHWPMIDDPSQVRQLVIGFLRKQLDLDLSGPQTSVGVRRKLRCTIQQGQIHATCVDDRHPQARSPSHARLRSRSADREQTVGSLSRAACESAQRLRRLDRAREA